MKLQRIETAPTSDVAIELPTLDPGSLADWSSRSGSQRVAQGPSNSGYEARKRVLDVVFASILILGLSPLLLGIALAIIVSTPGPALFRQQRYGRHKAIFTIVKFRTMRCADEGTGASQKLKDEDRITRLGRFLRISGLDELPQLANVIKGDMSLVGPRPHPMLMDDHFEPLISDYSRRFLIAPGISGLAQVRGQRGCIRDLRGMEQRAASDLEYIERRSLRLDLEIIARTPAVVFTCKST